MTDDSADILADVMAAAEEAAEAAARGDAGNRPRTWQERNLSYNRFGGKAASQKAGTVGAGLPAMVIPLNPEPPSLPFPVSLPAIVLVEDVGDYSLQAFEGLAGEPPGTSALLASMVELG